MPNKPNFFIVGAPKCGTTSLARWLSEDPEIFISPVKEPHHFNTDEKWVLTPKRTDYELLFDAAKHEQHAIGEASVWYLYSKAAVANIERYTNCKAKYVVCVRNPLEMAVSMHQQAIVSGNEHIHDFERAWYLQEERFQGKFVSRWCREPKHLAYGRVCSVGRQIEELLAQVEHERVHIVLMDDLISYTAEVYSAVQKFLGVNSTERQDFPVYNQAKDRASHSVRRGVLILGAMKRFLGIKRSFGFLNFIDRKNVTQLDKKPVPESLLAEMRTYFSEDVRKLEAILARDLSMWDCDA